MYSFKICTVVNSLPRILFLDFWLGIFSLLIICQGILLIVVTCCLIIATVSGISVVVLLGGDPVVVAVAVAVAVAAAAAPQFMLIGRR